LDACSSPDKLPDLIISDIMMPQIDGYLLAEKVRSNHAFDSIKIIAVTSDLRLGTRALAKEKGFNAFLAKPVYRDHLVKAIGSVFNSQNSDVPLSALSERNDDVSLRGVRVLIVDDTVSNQQLMKVFLDMWGCVSDLASNGQEAVDRIKTTHYDLCLMDLQMPVLDGFQAAKFIRTHINKKIPIIALTAAVMQEDIDRSYESGMNDFLPKPVDVNNLKSVLIKYAK
jgi:CheY-like chemotaxis protein